MLAGSKPGSTAISRRRERTRSPAPTSSTIASDICAMTSAPRSRAAGTPSVVRVVAACRPWIAAPERLNAAGKPNSTPTAMDTRPVTASTWRSRRMSAMRGTAPLPHQRPHRRAPAGVEVGSVRLELARDAGHFGLGALDRDAVPEPADRHRVAAVARPVRPVERHRLPVLLVAQRHWAEGRRHHADDARRPAGDRHRAPHDGPVGAETTPPQSLTEDDDPRAVGPRFLCAEGAAEQWRGAEDAEEVRRHRAALHLLGLVTGEGETRP